MKPLRHLWFAGRMQIGFPSFTLSERLAWILTSLVSAVAGRQRHSAVLAVIGLPLCKRIMRARNLVLMLMRRVAEGTLRRWAEGRRAAVRGTMDDAARLQLAERAWVVMPRRKAWLLPLVPCEAANLACGLAALLDDPEMRRFLAATPRIVEALRPVCRMLGVDAGLLEVGAEDLGVAAVASRFHQAAPHSLPAFTLGEGNELDGVVFGPV